MNILGKKSDISMVGVNTLPNRLHIITYTPSHPNMPISQAALSSGDEVTCLTAPWLQFSMTPITAGSNVYITYNRPVARGCLGLYDINTFLFSHILYG